MLVRLEFICAKCGEESTVFDDQSISGLSQSELWDMAEKTLVEKGWAVRRDEMGRRQAIGPHCIVKSKEEIDALPLFSTTARCAKCGCKNLKALYRTGRESIRLTSVEHILRTCNRCGHNWAEKPLDDGKKGAS